jgi:hypothetical protein
MPDGFADFPRRSGFKLHRLPRSTVRVLLILLSILQFAPPASAVLDFGNVQVSTIGHSFAPNSVTDWLVDQSQSSGSDGMFYLVLGMFNPGANQFEMTISAPSGKQFLVQIPAGQAIRFVGRIEWTKFLGTVVPPAEFGSVSVDFSDLNGAPPDFSASQSWLNGSGPIFDSFGFYNLESTTFTNELAFSAITMTATVQGTGFSHVPQVYYPTSNSAFGLHYVTAETNDPGPFVFIVSAPIPVVNLVLQTNGDIAITFTGVLQYANSANSSFDDVPGNPKGTYSIPKASLTNHQYFRARGR